MVRPSWPNARDGVAPDQLFCNWMEESNARNKADRNDCYRGADHRPDGSVLGVSTGDGCLAGISPLGKVKVEGRINLRDVPNRVDECRQRADECQRNAGQLVRDDVLRAAYLDLARHWRKLAHKARLKEFGSNTDAAPSSRADRCGFGQLPEWLAMICVGFKKSSSIRLLPR